MPETGRSGNLQEATLSVGYLWYETSSGGGCQDPQFWFVFKWIPK